MPTHIVIVGGGAGGLPLAARLGRRLGRRNRARITLVDSGTVHVWKPRFHEVATGAIDADLDAVDYRGHARLNHYHFQHGRVAGIDRASRRLKLAPLLDDAGREVLPERELGYDLLILAVGSVSNDFHTPGVRQHCLFLDSREQADRFHDHFLNACLRANYLDQSLRVAIVGAGATGVELTAELHHAVGLLHHYGHEHLDRDRLEVHLIEAGPRILPPLSERVANAATRRLQKLGVHLHTGTLVAAAEPGALVTREGQRIEADLLVWAAGIKAPDWLAAIEGLEHGRSNQLEVDALLHTSDPDIWAIGDCAACTLPDHDRPVPPRAQSAQQMARCVADNIERRLRGRPLKPFVYRDRGSLVSLSHYSSVGTLMGNLRGGSFFVEGWLARAMYTSLYRAHQAALYGWPRTLLLLLAGRFNRLVRPRLKLH